MIKIGITGGIGSGKSVVSTLFSVMGFPVYTADDESKRIVNSSPLIREQLEKVVGENVYVGNQLNKKELASFIFGNEEHLNIVNSIIHPVVRKDFLEWAGRQTSEICLIESAILFASSIDKIVDYSLLVYAPLEMRIARTIERDHTSRDAVLLRIGSQKSEEEKRSHCDFTITNDDQKPLIPQVESLVGQLLGTASPVA
jgi:dephospho-CoA kinase